MSDTSKENVSIIDMLNIFGDVEQLGENILKFSNEKYEKPIYLRYSIGETFSFIKGSMPNKIQMRNGFGIDQTKFGEKLFKIIADEAKDGSKVEKIYLGEIYLGELLIKLSNSKKLELRSLSFVHKPTKLEYECDFYRIFIDYDNNISYSFTPNFITIKNDIGTTLDIVMQLSQEIQEISSVINV